MLPFQEMQEENRQAAAQFASLTSTQGVQLLGHIRPVNPKRFQLQMLISNRSRLCRRPAVEVALVKIAHMPTLISPR